ncbi:hypothetical protein R6V09_15195 [Streptomyces sp. W16]|uniref:hypothetical protein n=1 Tax=Streptomyces sp. W16 TaxID=3076631 RepID=UPI00295B43ED|nr:hypothetical protein [Streptomyces sp. W16]MDV9171464.1 hypothetical protein [Streptomyces sp. W16]
MREVEEHATYSLTLWQSLSVRGWDGWDAGGDRGSVRKAGRVGLPGTDEGQGGIDTLDLTEPLLLLRSLATEDQAVPQRRPNASRISPTL